MAVQRNAAPAAGPFDVDNEFQVKCFICKGDARENPRGKNMVELKARISEGLGVTKAKFLSFARQTLPSTQLISKDLYFK